MASYAAPRSRSPHRRPLASKLNALAVLSEDEELTPTKKVAAPPAPAPALVLPTASPSKPTAADVAAADAALARMEAELAAQIRAPPPPPPAGSPDSSDSSSSDEDGAPPRRAASWRKSVGRRGSTGRRASLEHATPAQRRALRRLSAILADGGVARRARERESGARRAREAAVVEARARMVAQRRARLKSVAKMIDLALVWEWWCCGVPASTARRDANVDAGSRRTRRTPRTTTRTCPSRRPRSSTRRP